MITGWIKNHFINKLIFVYLIQSERNNYKTRLINLTEQKKVRGSYRPAEREKDRHMGFKFTCLYIINSGM
jgi:hypothetical protein